MTWSALGLAAAAAVCLAFASALQHHAAAGERGYRSGLHLLWRLVRNRRWQTGLTFGAAGILLHVAALHFGALVVVQAILVAGLAVALPSRELLDGARPSGAQVLAAVILACGVAVFVASVDPRSGQPGPGARSAALVIAAGAVVAALCTVVAARANSGRVAGFALGLGAGTLYGVVGGIVKGVVHLAVHDPAAAAVSWQLWTLAVLGAWALVIHQRAYAHAPLRFSLPVLSVANPLAGMIFGILAFRETPADGPLALAGTTLGLAVIVASVTILARPRATAGRAALAGTRAAK